MPGYKIFAYIIFVLSLLTQGVTIASQALSIEYYKTVDSNNNSDTSMDTNWGTFTFLLATASLSVIGYVVLLILLAMDKDIHEKAGLIWFTSVLCLQFGIATVLSVVLRNGEDSFDTAMTTLENLQNAGVTGSSVDLLRNL